MSLCRAVPLLALLSLAAPPAAPAQQLSLTLLDTAIIRAPQLDESSGVVASHRRPGVFWTHNDSGNRPLLFTTDSAGTDLGYVTLRGAPSRDWEAISTGPCTRSSGTCLYLGDIGDNNALRSDIRVYVIPEPEPPTSRTDTARVIAPEDTLILRYPDGPHDAEAIAVAGDLLYLVTKDRFGPARLFVTPIRGDRPRMLEQRGPLEMRTAAVRGRLATDAAISRDGRLLVVRTYMSLHVFALRGGQAVPLTDRDGLLLPVVEQQGEAICFDASGRLVLTSERGEHGYAILTRLRLNGVPAP